jgi:hypothetical protein
VSSVYSTQFLVCPPGINKNYVVPGGYRAVLKCVTASNVGPSPELVRLYHEPSGALLVAETLPAYVTGTVGLVTKVYLMTVVLNAGESLAANMSAQTDMSASGYLLTLP